MQVFFGTTAVDDRVRRILVDSLYSQPASLAIGAICAATTSLVAAHLAQNHVITVTACALTAVVITRVILAKTIFRFKGETTQRLEILFEIGAFSHAHLVGLVAAFCLAYDAPYDAKLLTVVNAVGYGVGIAARNAGRPAIAIGQLCLSLVPVVGALAYHGGLAYYILATTTALLLPGMASITFNVFSVLRNSVAAAETSARLADEMQILARTDVVTGLLNRAGLNHFVADLLANRDPSKILAVFWMDLDKFKEVNDTLGHQLGDKLLAEIAARLQTVMPDNAILARFGGDEFILVCEAFARTEIEQLSTAMMEQISRPMRFDSVRLEIGSSMGIAVMPDDGSEIETIMQGADLALYHAKVNGRKQVSFFNPSMTRDLVRRREIEAELRLALKRDELSIFFQPLVDLETGRIRSFEALVRWFHPEKGELRPDEFIPVAEETGAIITLGNWITAQAAKAAAQWPEEVSIAVNLSPVQIKAPGAALGILNALREARLDPSRLELEITETVLLDHSQNTEIFIAELSKAGVKFALDDFGTGYSSLSYLDKYPFSKIKVDRSFVSGINAGKTSDAIIRAVSGMGASLGMEIVAEGLETVEQVEAVRAAGCTLGQGYYFSRAVPDYLAAMLLAKEREDTAPQWRRTA